MIEDVHAAQAAMTGPDEPGERAPVARRAAAAVTALLP
jgi:hypothetical protein